MPIISVVIGEGGSGGALALGVANHVHMLENSTYSVISPEGAASILWKNAALAQKAAEAMRITAPNLKEAEIIEEIIPEVLGGAHKNVHKQAEFLKDVLLNSLNELKSLSEEELIEQRYDKFRKIGVFSE